MSKGMELLIAEMLGDVHQLHNELAALKAAMPQFAADFAAGAAASAAVLQEKAHALEARAASISDALGAADLETARQLLAETQQAVAQAKQGMDVLRDQSAGIAQVINLARTDYAHSAHALESAVARAKAAIDNPDIRQVASYEKTVLGLLGIGILAVASVGGFFAGRFTASSSQSKFAHLNDVPAMMLCAQGIPETRNDGSRVCTLATGIDPTKRVIAWRIQ